MCLSNMCWTSPNRSNRCSTLEPSRLAQVAHHLGWVVVEVVQHVRQRNLATVQILEGHVHLNGGTGGSAAKTRRRTTAGLYIPYGCTLSQNSNMLFYSIITFIHTFTIILRYLVGLRLKRLRKLRHRNACFLYSRFVCFCKQNHTWDDSWVYHFGSSAYSTIDRVQTFRYVRQDADTGCLVDSLL